MIPTKKQLIADYIALTDKFVSEGRKFHPQYLDIICARVFDWFPADGVPVAIELREKLVAKYPNLFKGE